LAQRRLCSGAFTTRVGTTQKKSGGRLGTAALKLSMLLEQEFYEDLYLTEQPYGFVSGVLTDLPAND
jgi:hypothetical protein